MSVRLSVTCMYCIHMAKDIVKLLPWHGSPMILAFWPRAPVPNSAKYMGVGKICDFRLKSPFISETPMIVVDR